MDLKPFKQQMYEELVIFHKFFFLYTAVESGLLDLLRTPSRKEELAAKMEASRPELLYTLLDLGAVLKELEFDGMHYSISGNYAKELIGKGGESLRALINQSVTVFGSAYLNLAARIKGSSLGNYLEGNGSMFAHASRNMEPFVAKFARSLADTGGPLKILDVGCGSGAYFRHVAEVNPLAEGVGINVQLDALELTFKNLANWGIGDRFKVKLADIRLPLPELPGPFNLIFLFNSIFYFKQEEQPALFRTIRSLLAPGGSLAVVSIVRENSLPSITQDLVLRSSHGCSPLPKIDELEAALKKSGFAKVLRTLLAPGVPPVFSSHCY